MALPTKKNLGQLREELSARLGYGGQGSQAGALIPILNNVLETSQYQMYWFIDWKELKIIKEIGPNGYLPVGVGQRFYDWHDDIDPLQLLNVVSVDETFDQGNVWPMYEGIDWHHDSYNTQNSRPLRYDRRDQLEIWPAPDRTTYTIRMEAIKRLGRFTQDGDLCTIDHQVVFLHALTVCKAHYGHKDVNLYISQMTEMTNRLRGKTSTSERLIRGVRHNDPFLDERYEGLIHRNTLDV